MSEKVALRPVLPNIQPAANPEEQFQNETLRPILKLQNTLLLRLYRRYLQKRKVPIQGFSNQQLSEWISQSISRDNRLRGLLFGMVIGLFTEDELTTYLEKESELNRRLTSLLIQRFQDQLVALRN